MTITTRTELGVANALSVLTQSVSLWAYMPIGRQSALHAGSWEFESPQVHHRDTYSKYKMVKEMFFQNIIEKVQVL